MSPTSSMTTAKCLIRSVAGVSRLWLDGVGAFLLCFDNQVRIGGPVADGGASAEVSLMSNLSRFHAKLIRSGEVWLLESSGQTSIDGRPVAKPRLLNDENRIVLGSSVALRFRLPSPLTGTARLDFDSSHRTRPTVDGIILFAETCVLGTDLDSHIHCREGSDRVLLTRRATGLWCQASAGVFKDGVASGTEVLCEPGKVYSGQNWRFRLESVV